MKNNNYYTNRYHELEAQRIDLVDQIARLIHYNPWLIERTCAGDQ